MPSINKLYPILLTFIMLSVPRLAMSRYENNDDKNIRENPEITQIDSIDCDIEIPAYINRNKNYIITNGADWSRFSRRTVAPDTTVSIVHIGDSHIQADGATELTRRHHASQNGRHQRASRLCHNITVTLVVLKTA